MTAAKYIRTEPPALLTAAVPVTLDWHTLSALNEYRQATHAWLSCAGPSDESNRLHEAADRAGANLAMFLAEEVRTTLGEPYNFEHPEDADDD